MRVMATREGFYDNRLRQVGDAFDLASAADFSDRWMARLELGPDRPVPVLADDSNTPPPDDDLAAAVAALNHDLGTHWTRQGKPDLGYLSTTLGRKVTRVAVDAAAPDVRRRPMPAS